MIRGNCPVCGRVFKVDDRFAGMAGRCKVCGATVRVPGEPVEGLDGLPSLPDLDTQEPESAAPSPPQTGAPPPSPSPEPQPGPSPATRPKAAAEPGAPPPEPRPAPPAPEPLRAHDARSRFEPDHGPTAVEGSWLKDQPAPPSAPEPEREGGPRAADVLPSSRIVTDLDTGPPVRRPVVVVVACIVVGLLGACFFIHFVSAGTYGAAAAGIGVVLAGMGILRLWAGYWDGMVPAALFCACVAGGAFLPSQPEFAQPAFLAGAGLAFLLLLLTVVLRSGREFFSA